MGNAGGKGQPVRSTVTKQYVHMLRGFIGVLLCANAASITSTSFLLSMSECLSVAPATALQIYVAVRQINFEWKI